MIFNWKDKTMTNLTENEKKLIGELIYSTFNGDVIDLSKSWSEQECFECVDYFESIIDTKRYSRGCGLSVDTIKGVLGSLVKKDLITLIDDVDSDDLPMSWLTINEKQFNAIKEGLAE